MDIRYHIGHFEHDGEITTETRDAWIKELEDALESLRNAVEGLSEDHLDIQHSLKG